MVNLTTYMIATTAMIMGISALDHASVEQVREALRASHIIPAASASAYASAAASMIVEANAKGKSSISYYPLIYQTLISI